MLVPDVDKNGAAVFIREILRIFSFPSSLLSPLFPFSLKRLPGLVFGEAYIIGRITIREGINKSKFLEDYLCFPVVS